MCAVKKPSALLMYQYQVFAVWQNSLSESSDFAWFRKAKNIGVFGMVCKTII
jgi:hypothetical protein